MSQIVLIAVTGLFSVIGFCTTLYLIFDFFMASQIDWKADVAMTVRLTEQTPVSELAETADYLCMRYFPGMEIVFVASEVSEEKEKEARIAARNYGIEVR